MSPNQQLVCPFLYIFFHNHVATTCKQKMQSHTQPFCKHTSHITFFCSAARETKLCFFANTHTNLLQSHVNCSFNHM
jgi:hypothetical protein